MCALTSCMCNLFGMVAALGLHRPANRDTGGNRGREVNEKGFWARGIGVKVAGVDDFFPPPGEGPPIFSHLF